MNTSNDGIGSPYRPDPLFILCKGRSGSTFLVERLIRHPQIGIAPESNFIKILVEATKEYGFAISTREELHKLLSLMSKERKFLTYDIDSKELFDETSTLVPLPIDQFVRRILLKYQVKNFRRKEVWGIKKGGWYAKNISTLRKLFPESLFIFLVRDGRAEFSSAKKAIHGDTGRPFESDPQEAARTWKSIMRAFRKYGNEHWAITIHYEEMIRDQEGTFGQVLSFLRVKSDQDTIDDMLQRSNLQYVTERDQHLHANVGLEPIESRISDWENSLPDSEVLEFERIAALELLEQGYELKHPYSSLTKMLLHLKFKALGRHKR